MKLKKDTKNIYIKIPSYLRNMDVVSEHISICKKKGHVWIMKMGKKPSNNYLEDVIKESGGIILKSHSRFGNKFYYANLKSIKPSKNENMYYPEYYNDIMKNMGISLDNLIEKETWLKAENFREISEEQANNFKIGNKDKEFTHVAKRAFQIPFMYITNTKDIEI